jgi:hypothetical protein
MIIRQWHGWTTIINANAYEALFRSKGPNTSEAEGRLGAFLLRRDVGDETEFIVQHVFTSMDAIQELYGNDYERSRLIPGAEALLARYDAHCTHYEVADKPRQQV